MDGSRHERAVLVVLSYVIGFLTAFIAFSIGSSSRDIAKSEVFVYEVAHEYDYRKFASEPSEPDRSFEMLTEVLYQDGRLLVQHGAESLLVSLNPEAAGFAADTLVNEPQGHHVTEPTYALAPDGAQLFFCEQQSVNEDVCDTFILDVNERIVRPVKVAGEPLQLSSDEAKEVVWNGRKLAFLDLTSIDETQPWNLTETY